MHNSEPALPSDRLSATSTAGPLPKSDSVHSLVSLLNCPSQPSSSFDDGVIRGVDATASTHSVQVTSETDYISLSGHGLKTIALCALDSTSAARTLREISLAANALELVDLAPLASCPALTVLCLNSNRIASVDLSPLSRCQKLERLWLHDNKLESVDLTPLKACRSLRSLYLEDNSLHETTLDLAPLAAAQNLRSLRLSGNRLNGKLDLTPLLNCPALSVLNIDSSVTLVSDGESSQARVSPALRRIVLDIKFTGRVIGDKTLKRRTTPPVSPTSGYSPTRLRRRMSPLGSAFRKSPPSGTAASKLAPPPPAPIVKVLLVGFRRLARYAAEDSFTRCGKIMIRAANQDVASRDPALLLDSHLVILYAPSEKTLRQITVVVGRIPTVVIGTERYRSTADNRMLELLDRFNFYADPLDPEDTRVVYNMGKDYATGSKPSPGTAVDNADSASSLQPLDSSPVSEDEALAGIGKGHIRKSFSESSIVDAFASVTIEMEHIEDEDDYSAQDADSSGQVIHRSQSAERMNNIKLHTQPDVSHLPATTWSEVTRRLRERRCSKTGRGWGSYSGSEMSMHGKNKLRVERAAVEVAFSDLGGYASIDSCAGIARSCGLPKCAGPLLFRAAFGSSFEIESTTPEAGVPNPPLERKNRRISSDAFLSYWESRLKAFDGEERLSNLLADNYSSRPAAHGSYSGHSVYGAPLPRKAQSSGCISLNEVDLAVYSTRMMSPDRRDELLRRRSSCISLDVSCPCDAGIESLITAFMEGRSSRFGSFALVKMSEAIAIGSSLVMYGLRGVSRNRVGGHARPVCPKEVRQGKLNAALVAAEAGIFEGVASGLSMDQIRSVKGCYATEASPAAVSCSGGLALSYNLRLEEVQRFCTSRKTLLPAAVQVAMATHCRKQTEMNLSEFAIFLSVLNNISSNGAVDYFFSVVDVDHDGYWTLPDLRHFHMEKERMWLCDGMAVSDLGDIWVNLLDMVRPSKAWKGISRREFMNLASKERKLVLQSLLFVDDDHSVLNIRRTMELNKNSTSPVVM